MNYELSLKWIITFQFIKQHVRINTSYRIGFCSVLQNYAVSCEHIFPSNICVEYEFKNFEQYFNVFWWKKQPFEKKQEKVQQ